MIHDGLRPLVRLTAWTAGLVVAARMLLAAGTASLAMPLTSLDDLSAWLARAAPADMAVALLRLAGLAAVYYLLAATALAVLVRVGRVQGLAAAVDRVTPGIVRRVVTGGSGMGLVLGVCVGSLPSPTVAARPERSTIAAASGPPAATAPVVATMTRGPDATATMSRVTATATPPAPDDAQTTAATAAPEATMTRLGEPPEPSEPPGLSEPPEPFATMTRVDTAAATPPGATTPRAEVSPAAYEPVAPGRPTAPASPRIDPTAWVIEPGDSLWSVAQDVLTTASGPAPGERVVARYWRRLIEANRSHLVDPDNPDLLVPGQHLVVPPPDG